MSSCVNNMYRVVSFFWFFFSSYAFHLFRSFFRYFLWFHQGKSIDKNESVSYEVYQPEHGNPIGSSHSVDSEIDQNEGKGENFVVMETALSASTNRYEFSSGKGTCGFIKEPRTMNLIVHEMFLDSNNDAIISNSVFDTGGSTEEAFYDVGLEADEAAKAGACDEIFQVDEETVEKQEQENFVGETGFQEVELVSDDGVTRDSEETESSVESLVIGEVLKETFTKEKDCDEGKNADLKLSFGVEQDSSGEVQLLFKCHSFPCDAEQDSASSNDELLSGNEEIGSTNNEFSATVTDGDVCEQENPVCLAEEKEQHLRETEPVLNGAGPESCELVDEEMEEYSTEQEDVSMRDQFIDSEEYIELQPQKQHISLFSREDLSNTVDKQEQQESVKEKEEPKPDGYERSEESSFKDQKSSNDINLMFEHHDIIEQLKLELKLARTGGLPTILEESESEELETPKTVQELKPMKIDGKKFEHKDVLDGIQKVYKSYLDKMRKLDILNFQTMHALGLLQIKDSVEQFQTARKSSFLAITSLLSQNLWLCKGTAVVNPLKKVVADMNMDFETIYVGQLCLSWEILHWQYWKVQELQHYSESQGSHQYNQVAGEFQLFQVLIQRFIENEQFQGPRVQNYVKNRCVLRSLLQVPLVKADCVKYKGKKSDDGEATITSQMLTVTIEQAMRVYWDFLRADKDESSVIFQGNLQTHPNLQDLVDLELLTDVRSDFQKKDKKLKDILRSGNCIVKKLKKQQEDGMHQTVLIAQVELKLISRVLNMSKLTTDQLIWCHEKLDKINIRNRKVFVESSFLLFPC